MDPRYRKPDPRATSTPPQRQDGIESQIIEYAVSSELPFLESSCIFYLFFHLFRRSKRLPPGHDMFFPLFSQKEDF